MLSLNVLPVSARFICRHSKQSKNMHVWLIGNSKLAAGVTVTIHGRLSRLYVDSMDWHGELSGMYSTTHLRQTDGLQRCRNLMQEEKSIENN